MSSSRSILVSTASVVVELLGDLVTADPREVVPLGVAEERLDEVLGGLDRGRLARAQLAIEIDQRLVAVVGGVALDRVADRLGPVEEVEDLLIGLGDAQRPQEGGDVLASLAIDPDTDRVALVGVELEPGPAARDDAARVDQTIRTLVRAWRRSRRRVNEPVARRQRARCR